MIWKTCKNIIFIFFFVLSRNISFIIFSCNLFICFAHFSTADATSVRAIENILHRAAKYSNWEYSATRCKIFPMALTEVASTVRICVKRMDELQENMKKEMFRLNTKRNINFMTFYNTF